MATNTHLIIAAIDFGTTYSGYAYGLRHKLENFKLNEEIPINARPWKNELGSNVTDKTPTSILFTHKGEFDSFGYEAEKKYAELADDNEHKGWRFFKHFKMELHDSRVGRNTRLKADQGESMLAIDVFAAAIRYLKTECYETIKNALPELNESDIDWVITVPAIWTYRAKQFMKEAAIAAGLSSKWTCLAHEPEAAAIYCSQFHVNLSSDTKGNIKLSRLKEGTQIMVLDLGGGTVDITTCEVQIDGTLKDLCPRGGGPWGGIIVNAALYRLFEEEFGDTFMTEFAKENKYDHLTLSEALELKKRLTKSSNEPNATIRVTLPSEFLEFYKTKNKKKLEETLSNPDQYPNVKRGKICFAQSRFEEAFREPIKMLIKEVNTLISKYNLKKVDTFMMVGGFAESPIMQKAVKDAFPDKIHVIPEEPSTVVMKGAVMYGFRKEFIQSRIIPYTFGLSTSEEFDPLKHPLNRRYPLNRRSLQLSSDRVHNIFSPFLFKGTEVKAGGIVVEKRFGTGSGNAVEIYQTPADKLGDIAYTDDERLQFEEIGHFRISTSTNELADVLMTFGIFDVEVATRTHGDKEWKTVTFDTL